MDVVSNFMSKNTKENTKIHILLNLKMIEFCVSEKFISKLKNKIVFADLKIHDIPNTCVSTIKAIKDLKINSHFSVN